MVSSSPKLFAATHVLHRLLAPRHPPFALTCLTKFSPRTRAPPQSSFPVIGFRLRPHTQNAFSIGHRKTIRLSKTAESKNRPSSGLFRAGRPQGAIRNHKTVGGADRDRTDDLRLAKPALSQLSYSPEFCGLPRGRDPAARTAGRRLSSVG